MAARPIDGGRGAWRLGREWGEVKDTRPDGDGVVVARGPTVASGAAAAVRGGAGRHAEERLDRGQGRRSASRQPSAWRRQLQGGGGAGGGKSEEKF